MSSYREMTQAGALACRPCRAEAISSPHPSERNHEQSLATVRQIPAFGEPLPRRDPLPDHLVRPTH